MKSEAELWAAAIDIVEQHGGDACIFAGLEADAALVDGDVDKLREWRVIIRRVRMLLDGGQGIAN